MSSVGRAHLFFIKKRWIKINKNKYLGLKTLFYADILMGTPKTSIHNDLLLYNFIKER
jgi:hypothetical protein